MAELANLSAVENATASLTEAASSPALSSGLLLAYAAMLIMALIPIVVGSFSSVKRALQGEFLGENSMTQKDATMFPLQASAALLGLYVLFKYLGPEYVNMLLSAYFLCIGMLSISQSLKPFLVPFLPASFTENPYKLSVARLLGKEETKDSWSQLIDKADVVCMALALPLGMWYLATKHWIANNIFGLSFSINGISMLALGNFKIACLLLGGLFIYDIFWVFGTDVMVTVAKNFDAPIKVVFPKDLLENGLAASKHAMLGLGDIVIPGVVIALLLRFDHSLKLNSNVYFLSTFVAYIVGLVTTIVVMHTFQAAQPALLYLVPACLLTPLALSAVRGETSKLLAFSDSEPLDSTVVVIKKEEKSD